MPSTHSGQHVNPNPPHFGPSTDEGKRIASRNAVKHGLTARSIEMLPEELQLQYIDYHAELQSEHLPATVAEQLQFEQYAFFSFMALRAMSLEARAFHKLEANLADESLDKQHRRAARYQRSLANQAKQALQKLEQLQLDRFNAIPVQDTISDDYQSQAEVPATAPITKLLATSDARYPRDQVAIQILRAENNRLNRFENFSHLLPPLTAEDEAQLRNELAMAAHAGAHSD
jgi:hypothetical protein